MNKDIRDASYMVLVKMLWYILGEEEIDNLLLDALGIEENNTEEEQIQKEHENE